MMVVARLMALDVVTCLAIALPLALAYPRRGSLILLGSVVVAVTLLLPTEIAEEYRFYGVLSRLAALVAVVVTAIASIVYPSAARMLAENLLSSAGTAIFLRALVAVCVGLVAVVAAREFRR